MNKHMQKISIVLILVVVILAVLSQIHIIVERAYSLANKEAAIATVNGGDYEFAVQQGVKSGGKLINGSFILAYCVVIIIGGTYTYKNSKKMLKKSE